MSAAVVTCHDGARITSLTWRLPIIASDGQVARGSGYEGPDRIVAWREPPREYRQRDLALAGLQISASHKLPALLRESMKLLEALPEAQQNNDPDVLASLEVSFLDSSSPEKALALSRWAVASTPQSATFALNYGLALKRAGDLKQAAGEFLRAIELDPSLMQAYAELAIAYDAQGRQAESIAAIDRFMKWNPQTIQFRLAKAPR